LVENLTLEQLKHLAQQTQSPCISIFMPTHQAGQDTQQDPIRLKNLLREAELQLLAGPLGPRAVSALLQPAQALLEQSEALFWQHQREGLAVFIAPDDFHVYHLPFGVEQRLVIARAYYFMPLVPLFTSNGHYYILALSQDEVRLFEGTRYGVGQIDLPAGTPVSLDETLQEDNAKKQLQFHSAGSPGGVRASVFHGQGPGDEEQKERLERYLNLVDAGLQPLFRDAPAPLVLAGVDYLLPIYRKVSDYRHLLSEGIAGSPEHLRPEELQAAAWPLVEPLFRQEVETAVGQFQQLAGTDKATDDVEAIVTAAVAGRVDKLIVAADAQVWGQFDFDTGQVVHSQAVQSPADDLALLDFAVTQTLQNGGSVYALAQVDMPTTAPAAAVFRY
jgi:hypothetical protein